VDNLTHTLTGLVVARAGLGRLSPGATLAAVLASNVPDLDLLFGLEGTAAYLQHHRDLSHSILGAPVLALGIAGAVRLFRKDARTLPLFLVSLLAVAIHVFMDLWTSYGTRVLAPFDRTFYTWDLVFIVDPWLLLILLVSLLAGRSGQPARVASLALGLALAYVGVRAILHVRALDEGLARVPFGSSSLVRAAALPSPLDPRRWRFLADTGATYFTGEVRLWDGSTPLRRRQKHAETPAVARVRESSAVAATFLRFSTFPWLEVSETDGGTELSWTDLRFERPERQGFVARVVVDKNGRVMRESFHF
jgi:inner membrane protein